MTTFERLRFCTWLALKGTLVGSAIILVSLAIAFTAGQLFTLP